MLSHTKSIEQIMKRKIQPGFFDIAERTAKLTQMGDPLVGLKEQINWEAFRPDLNRAHEKERKSNAGAKPIDVVLMFKVLVLQQLHNLSHDRIEYQIRDRLSFMRFLGLQLEDRVPDAKTVWLFREHLKELKLVEVLFNLLPRTTGKPRLHCTIRTNDRRHLCRSAASAQHPHR
jgi:IS5 family transposase